MDGVFLTTNFVFRLLVDFVLGNEVALFVLLVVGVVCRKRIGTCPEFDRVKDKLVHEAKADRINRDDPHEEVDARIEPLVAQGAVPTQELLGETVATMAAKKGECTRTKQCDDYFFIITNILQLSVFM